MEQKHYTLTQIRRGAKNLEIDTMLICYAIAMYSSREDFNIYHQMTGQDCNYDMMRGEIINTGSTWFGGSSFDSYDSGGSFSDGGEDGGD